jgi:hypothetical protein
VSLLLAALVTVIVHNTAGIPDTIVRRAEATIERVFRDTGVTLIWGTLADMHDGFTIHVMIRREPGGGPGSDSPSATGTTIGDDHARGGVSFVFYDRLVTCAHRYDEPVDLMLALTIAHEMGHVLLPAPAHSPSGIMKAEWDGDDIRRLTTGVELFTEEQSALIRRSAERRR